MDNNKLIKLFYEKLPYFKKGWTFKQQLGVAYDDAIQNTLIHLIKYNEHTPIIEEKAVGLFYFTLTQQCMLELNNHHQSEYYNDFQSKIINLDEVTQVEEISDTQTTDDNNHIQYYREKLLEMITMDEYTFLLEYFTTLDDENKILPNTHKSKLARLKMKLGLSFQYRVTVDDEEYYFNSLTHMCEALNWNYSNVVNKYKDRGSFFKYKNKNVQIKKITKLDPQPKKRKYIKKNR
jgi:hypothetical protein